MTVAERHLRVVQVGTAAVGTAQEVATKLANVHKSIGALRQVVHGCDGAGLRLGALLGAMAEALRTAEDAALAARLLAQGVPLAAEFPEGDPVPTPATPRQVLYAANLAAAATGAPSPTTGLAPRPPARQCTARRTDGAPCRAFALRWLDGRQTDACVPHSPPGEVDANRGAEAAWLAGHPDPRAVAAELLARSP